MSENEIILTPEELAMIKDDVRFKENTTLQLKYLTSEFKDVQSSVDCLKTLKGWITAHTWAIGILFVIIGWLITYIVR